MAQNSYQALKVILWIVAAYHIVLGLLGIFAKGLSVVLAKIFFNFNLTLTPQMEWVINPFAAYLLIFGVFMALAAQDPVKYKNVIFAGIGLFALRIEQRIVIFIASPEGLVNQVDPTRNIIAIVIVSAIGVAMYVLARKI